MHKDWMNRLAKTLLKNPATNYYRMASTQSKLRVGELRSELIGGVRQPGVKPDTIYTGRLAKYLGADRIYEDWDLSEDQGSDLFRSMHMALLMRVNEDPDERRMLQIYRRLKLANRVDLEACELANQHKAATAAAAATTEATPSIDAHVARKLIQLRASVAFKHSEQLWIRKLDHLPLLTTTPLIEAVDAHSSLIMSPMLLAMGRLSELRFLRLRLAPFVDDGFVCRLAARCQQLEVLDLSACPHVTWHSIACLWRLRKLKRLVLADNPQLDNADQVVATQLEQLSDILFVDGLQQLSHVPLHLRASGDSYHSHENHHISDAVTQ